MGFLFLREADPNKKSATQIYNLFPHSQSETPSPVVIGGNTVYPPDDTKPNAQTITLVPGYIFYDYQDTTGVPRTLVYDMEAKGWSVDTYTPTANCHSWAIGNVNQILLGCTDGTVRQFANSGTETRLGHHRDAMPERRLPKDRQAHWRGVSEGSGCIGHHAAVLGESLRNADYRSDAFDAWNWRGRIGLLR